MIGYVVYTASSPYVLFSCCLLAMDVISCAAHVILSVQCIDVHEQNVSMNLFLQIADQSQGTDTKMRRLVM